MILGMANSSHAWNMHLCGERLRKHAIDPANDNPGRPNEAMLHAALRHFASHGLDAARSARQQAEQALTAGDQQTYSWWLEICRALDRRMAFDLARKSKIAR